MLEQAGPVEAVAQKLRSYFPRSLSALIAILQNNEDFADFVHIVKDLLPEYEREILTQTTVGKQIAVFAVKFDERYFPLHEYFQSEEPDLGYEEIVRGIPLITLGIGWEEYSYMVMGNGNHGITLMTYFFQHPYGEDSERIAMADTCEELVSRDLLQKVPANGFTPGELHTLLDGTPYAALAVWGDMLNLDTGNIFLDTDDEMDGYSTPSDWNRENVEWLTTQWREAQEKHEPVDAMSTTFEDNPREYFQKVIEFINKRQEAKDGSSSAKGD